MNIVKLLLFTWQINSLSLVKEKGGSTVQRVHYVFYLQYATQKVTIGYIYIYLNLINTLNTILLLFLSSSAYDEQSDRL